MSYHHPVQEYLNDLLEWSNNMQLQWQRYQTQLDNETDQRKGYIRESEITDLQEEIRKTMELPLHHTEIYENVGKIKGRSDRLYKDWLSFLKKGEGDSVKQSTSSDSGSHKPGSPTKPDVDFPLQPVPIGEHKLPPLPYPYDALEPNIEEEIMRLHHDKHHKGYVEGLNKAEKKMAEARKTGDYDLIRHWEREAAFNGAGHYLHTIFWKNMSPTGGGKPTGELARFINQTFGSFDQFKKHFTEAADKVEGVGWAILVWSPRAHRLEILQAEKHQFFSQWDVIPLLVLDVWEHAYYLQYKTDRKQYIENWWNLVNWEDVSYRFKKAKELRWQPY
jgi:Fe-Mn family superoxide dismutase